MAIVKQVLKKVRQQAVVKVVGSGTITLDLDELSLSDETLDRPNVKVNVTGLMWSTTDSASAPIVINRDGVALMYLHGNDNWSMSQMFGVSDTANNYANIQIVPPNNCTLYLHLTKEAGYVIDANTFIHQNPVP